MKHFKPAFLGRLKVIPYYPIPDDGAGADHRAQAGAHRPAHRRPTTRLNSSYDEALVDAVLARCTEVDSGARNVDNILNGTLLPEIAEAVLAKMARRCGDRQDQGRRNAKGEFKYTIK
jgi:type VI secretion system protein VasG